MKNILCLIFISSFVMSSFAQPAKYNDLSTFKDSTVAKKDIRVSIIKVLGKHLNHEILFETPKNNAFLFSIALSVNNSGTIDGVYYPKNISKKILEIINPGEQLTEALKKVRIPDKAYKNKILLLPILFKRPEDTAIANLNDFVKSYLSFYPEIPKGLNKQLYLLDPFINNFFDPIK